VHTVGFCDKLAFLKGPESYDLGLKPMKLITSYQSVAPGTKLYFEQDGQEW